jgi:hypothetical protein
VVLALLSAHHIFHISRIKVNAVRVFENRVLRKICSPKKDEVTGQWRRLHNEELHDRYSTPDMPLECKGMWR